MTDASNEALKDSLVQLEKVAESYSPSTLSEIEPVGRIRNYIDVAIEGTRRVENSQSRFYPMEVLGYYGSGKTFFVRKLSEKIIKELEKTIPIHFYLRHASSFDLMKFIDDFISDVEAFVNNREPKETISGDDPEKWGEYLKVLKEARAGISDEEISESNVDAFIKFLRNINSMGYYPLVFFDEFESVWVEGIIHDDRGLEVFTEFSSRLFEIIRGRYYNGGICFVLTKPVKELIKEANDVNPRLIRILNDRFGTNLADHPEVYPLEREPARQTLNLFTIKWGYEELDLLTKKYNMVIHEDILRAISRVLPTPRAVINICSKLRTLNENVSSPSVFGKLVEDKLEEFITKVASEFLAPNSKWHLRFKALIENGLIYINPNDRETIEKIGELFGISADNYTRLRQKVKTQLDKLRKLGLLEYNKAYSEYTLSPDILAFLLGIERLPDGSKADAETLKLKLKNAIEERRRRRQRI